MNLYERSSTPYRALLPLLMTASMSLALAACKNQPASESPPTSAAAAPDMTAPAETTAPEAAQKFVCDDDIDRSKLTPKEQALADELWEQTLTYLRGFVTALETSRLCLDSPLAVIQTNDGKTNKTQTRCVSRYRDVELMVKHVNWVLDNPKLARNCFDVQKNYEAFQLYAPTEAMKQASEVAAWIDRPTLEEYHADKEGEVGEAGRDLIENFEAILKNTNSTAFVDVDMTYQGLPDLWTAVGWLPFYAENPKAINQRFRGGYAYAEVMGPWGLLRIKEIEGELVGAEVGMTIQVESFYPYHFHHSQELYMNIGKSSCAKQNTYMVMHWDNPSFAQTRTDIGWDVTIDKTDHRKATWFRPTSPSDPNEWIAYYERNAIHATKVGGKCGKGQAPPGFAQVWARTSSRDNNQTTKICVPVDAKGNTIEDVEEVTPYDRVVCHLEDWKP
ncbi:MAG TPA: dimethylsulfonioproprionate lyase family protein [Polyangiales bacterium]|nr:dimethylsulfonioproprionate lyase family protein [Polyangiales bacterium]